jgi:hypothetical protein
MLILHLNTLQIRLTQIKVDVQNAIYCSTHIPDTDTQIRVYIRKLKLFLGNTENFPLDIRNQLFNYEGLICKLFALQFSINKSLTGWDCGSVLATNHYL